MEVLLVFESRFNRNELVDMVLSNSRDITHILPTRANPRLRVGLPSVACLFRSSLSFLDLVAMDLSLWLVVGLGSSPAGTRSVSLEHTGRRGRDRNRVGRV